MKKILCLLLILLFSGIQADASNIKFVQVDNLRFSENSEDSIQNLKTIINDINNQKDISFVIFTGNNIAKSEKNNLKKFLKTSKKLEAPFYVALGHKDLNQKKGLSKKAYIDIVKKTANRSVNSPNYVFVKKGVVFIVADGAKEVIPTPFGYYRDAVISWVDREIRKYPDKNIVILQHFPIYPPNENEAYRTFKADEYMKMLENHKNVKAVISGFGINSENDVDGIKHITTASYPAYRIIEIIDCDTPNPTIWSTLK